MPKPSKTAPRKRETLAQEIQRRLEAILNYPRTVGSSAYVQSQAEYQEHFTGGAPNKADEVLKYARACLKDGPMDKMIYLSVGGGDGSELGRAMSKGGFGRGLLVEWMDPAVETARKLVPPLLRPGQQVEYMTGDVGQKHDLVQAQLDAWRREGMTGMLLSAQAVLHELPWRADPEKFFWGKLISLFHPFDVKLFHSREPCLPGCTDGGAWLAPVRVGLPFLDGARLCGAIKLVQEHYLSFRKEGLDIAFQGKVLDLGNECQAPGPAVVEFLHKFMRHWDARHLRHEMEECLAAFDPQWIQMHLNDVFGGAQHVSVEYSASQGFRDEYHRLQVQARSADRLAQLPVPQAFCWIKAFHAGGRAAAGRPGKRQRPAAEPAKVSAPAAGAGPRSDTATEPPSPGGAATQIGTVIGQVVAGNLNIAGDQTFQVPPPAPRRTRRSATKRKPKPGSLSIHAEKVNIVHQLNTKTANL